MTTVSSANSVASEPRSSALFKTDSLAIGILFALSITVVQRLIGFVRGIILCRMLPDEQLGQWSLTWSFLMMMAPLAALGMPGTFCRYSEYFLHRGQLRTYVSRVIGVATIGSVSLAIFMMAFPGFFSWMVFRETSHIGLVRMIAVVYLSVCVFNLLSSLLESLRQIRLVTLMRFISGVGFTFLAVGLLFVYQESTSAIVIGFGASCVLGCIPAIWFILVNQATFQNTGESLTQSRMWSKIAPFAAWLWITNMLTHVYESADRYMLLHISPVSNEQAQSLIGQYHSGRVIPLLLISIATVLSGILMPYLSAAWEKGDREKAKSQVRWTLKVTGFAFTAAGVLILISSPLIFHNLLNGRYDAGLSVLPLTLVYCIWYSLTLVGHDYLWCAERGKAATCTIAVGVVANIICNAVLIPSYGLQGAVAATAIANAFALIVLFVTNAYFGMKTDLGIWLIATLPLVLLLGPLPALTILTLFFSAAAKSDWVFDQSEKNEITAMMTSLVAKLSGSSR